MPGSGTVSTRFSGRAPKLSYSGLSNTIDTVVGHVTKNSPPNVAKGQLVALRQPERPDMSKLSSIEDKMY